MTERSQWFGAAVAILGTDGEPIGAGFLVTERQVLTCAHVVNVAIGADPIDPARPEYPVLVRFPLSGSARLFEATVVGWAPVGTEGADDIALLELADESPARPVRLVDTSEVWGHGFRTYGFPDGHPGGLWATGLVRGPQSTGWIQLEDVKTPGAAVEGGFSGGAVYDEQLDAVIGMIVARDVHESRKIGFMLPAALLVAGVPGLAAHVEAHEDPAGVLSGVPSLPPHFVARTRELGLVADSLRSDLPTDGRQVAIVGMGGAGKSVLAAAISREPAVRRAFPDGVVWIELGPAPSIPERQAQLAGAFGMLDAAFVDAQQGKAALTKVLADLRCLVVLDNVWDVAHLGSFDILGDDGRLLITTRDARLARAVGATRHDLGVLDREQAVALLAEWAGQPMEGLTKHAAELASECGDLPLALAMAGAMVGGRPDRWSGVLRRLRGSDLGKIRQSFANYPYPTLLRALSASVDALEPDQRERYYELSIFQDRRATCGAVEMLWGPAGLDDLDTQDLLDTFVDRSLGQWDADGRLVLHDLQMDYVRHHTPRPEGLHRRLVDAYGSGIRRDWPSGPNDGYYFENLVHHLAAAGYLNEVRNLLLDLRWLTEKLAATDVTALLADFELTDQSEAAVRTVRDALRMAAHVLAKNPEQLRAQLVGRLADQASEPVQRLVAAAREWRGESWLCPAGASLAEPGGPLLRSLVGHTSFAPGLASSHDAQRAISGAADGTVRVWDLGSGAELHTLRGHESGVWSVAITPDDQFVISGSNDATVRVWDIESGTERHVLRGHQGTVWSVVVIPGGGPRIASASADGTIRVWDLTAGAEQLVLRGHEAAVVKIVPSADGRVLASKSSDGTLRIWDLSDGNQILCLDSGERQVQSFAMALTARHALFAGDSGRIHVWNLADGSLAHVLDSSATGRVWEIVVTSDGNRAITSSTVGPLTVWDLGTGAALRVMHGHVGWVEQLAVAPDERHILSGGDDAILRLWDIDTGTPTATMRGHGGWIVSAALTPDGLHAISGASDSMLRVWDLKALAAGRSVSGHSGWVSVVSVIDSETAVSASDDGSLRLWDIATGAERNVLSWHVGPVTGLAVTEDGSFVASGSYDGSVAVWRVATGVRKRELPADAPVTSVVLTAGDRHIVAGTTQGTLNMWDLDTGANHCVLPFGESVEQLRASPGGRLVAAGGALGTVTVWDGETGEHLRDFRGKGGPILTLAFTPDAERVVSGCIDGMLTMWDVRSGRLIWERHAHTSLLNTVHVLGDRLVSGGGDGSILVWRSADGERLSTLMTGSGPVRALTATADDRHIIGTSAESLVLFDIGTGARITGFDGDSAITSVSVGGALVCGEATGAVHVLHLRGPLT
ncbi:NB-ARC domain-containing protein [Streptosporangium sp. NPDC000509]|uniref:NB-ARC domain-containing protein n=1 Tax=Streptosporangium sp. NPDC000509 TaxID=3366186 RepID=UPI0036C70CC8